MLYFECKNTKNIKSKLFYLLVDSTVKLFSRIKLHSIALLSERMIHLYSI